MTGAKHLAIHHLQGLPVFGMDLGMTSAALSVLHLLAPPPNRVVEVAVLVVADLGATQRRLVL